MTEQKCTCRKREEVFRPISEENKSLFNMAVPEIIVSATCPIHGIFTNESTIETKSIDKPKLRGIKSDVIIHDESSTFKTMNQALRNEAFNHNREYYHNRWDGSFKMDFLRVDDKDFGGGQDGYKKQKS